MFNSSGIALAELVGRAPQHVYAAAPSGGALEELLDPPVLRELAERVEAKIRPDSILPMPREDSSAASVGPRGRRVERRAALRSRQWRKF